jgi:hypothetical protein
LLKNKIKQESAYVVRVSFDNILRLENHAIGVVAISDERDIKASTKKLVYEFKG